MLTLICVAWILGLCRRIRWLRWRTVICGGFGLLAIPSLAASDTLGLQSALYLAQCVTLVIASVLLLLPSASAWRSEEHTSELQSLMRTSYAVFCLKKTTTKENNG